MSNPFDYPSGSNSQAATCLEHWQSAEERERPGWAMLCRRQSAERGGTLLNEDVAEGGQCSAEVADCGIPELMERRAPHVLAIVRCHRLPVP